VVKVNISTYGSVSKEAGWSYKEVRLEKVGAMVKDALKAAELRDGKTLLDLVADGGSKKSIQSY